LIIVVIQPIMPVVAKIGAARSVRHYANYAREIVVIRGAMRIHLAVAPVPIEHFADSTGPLAGVLA
jgi:hypothetical protein